MEPARPDAAPRPWPLADDDPVDFADEPIFDGGPPLPGPAPVVPGTPSLGRPTESASAIGDRLDRLERSVDALADRIDRLVQDLEAPAAKVQDGPPDWALDLERDLRKIARSLNRLIG